jgi:protein-L-isoaspartate(D-aspartate) O-methyltransferase
LRRSFVCLVSVACLGVLLAHAKAAAQTARSLAAARNWMVESSVAAAGVKHPAILAAMRTVPRHEFVPAELASYAYFDQSLPIGEKQTISPPFIVAWMTEQLDPQPTDRVLEIGTGSGYQAAVLSQLVADVYTIEINEPLAKRAAEVFQHLGYKNIHARLGDGFQGWAEHAPFDKIIVTCSPEKVPAPLVEQLREGGRVIIPLGERFQQNLCLLTKQHGKLTVETREPTYFVPMTGRAESLRSVHDAGPLTPLANGDFEELLEAGKPAVWFYLRQATIEPGGANGDSRHYLECASLVGGSRSHAMQSFGVDGRKVRELIVSAWVRGDDIRPHSRGGSGGEARIVVSFFDDQRRVVSEQGLGPWRGTFDWRPQTGHLEVPPNARGATLVVGLFGATGRLGCDLVDVRAGGPRTAGGVTRPGRGFSSAR